MKDWIKSKNRTTQLRNSLNWRKRFFNMDKEKKEKIKYLYEEFKFQFKEMGFSLLKVENERFLEEQKLKDSNIKYLN